MNDIQFMCNMVKGQKVTDQWEGVIKSLRKHNGYFEMMIDSRSCIFVIFGEARNGGFCCIPDWKAGCELASYTDYGWNLDRLKDCMKNKIDAITVARALYEVGVRLDGNGNFVGSDDDA